MGSGATPPDSPATTPNVTRVRDVVRDVVGQIRAVELPLVDMLAQFDDATVVRRLRRRRRRRKPLGFGLDQIEVLVTPVVWVAVYQAARRIGTLAADGVAAGGKSLLRRVFRRKTAPVTIPPLTEEQRADVRRLVLEIAERRRVKKDLAEAIADAVYFRLAPAAHAGRAPDSDGSTDDGTLGRT